MLALAAIACSGPMYDGPFVWAVAADPDQPGRAYALVDSTSGFSSTPPTEVVYQTDDFGQNWRLWEGDFPDLPARSLNLDIRDEILYIEKRQAIWSFPRASYRYIFAGKPFQDRYGFPHINISNSLQGDTLYVALGSQGVLVGRLTQQPALVDWQITSTGIDVLTPFPLTITDPDMILSVVARALLIPPFALIHAFLLYCLWVYLLPPGRAAVYAIMTTFALTVIAALGIVVWLTDIRIEFYPMVAVVSSIVVLTGVAFTLLFARAVPDAPPRKYLVGAAVRVSLIVPAAVALVWAGWWAVFIGVFGFGLFRWAYFNAICPDPTNWRQRWLVDRLAMDLVGGVSLLAVMLSITIVGLLIVLFMFWKVTNEAQERLLQAATEHGKVVELTPEMQSRFDVAAFVWPMIYILAIAATFIAQLEVRNWFLELLP